jgi:hypothetical protein
MSSFMTDPEEGLKRVMETGGLKPSQLEEAVLSLKGVDDAFGRGFLNIQTRRSILRSGGFVTLCHKWETTSGGTCGDPGMVPEHIRTMGGSWISVGPRHDRREKSGENGQFLPKVEGFSSSQVMDLSTWQTSEDERPSNDSTVIIEFDQLLSTTGKNLASMCLPDAAACIAIMLEWHSPGAYVHAPVRACAL